MSWKRLTVDDLRLTLSEDEIDKLSTRSLDTNLSGVIQDQLDTVADAFRGSWSAKGYTLDVRDHYVAPEYKQFVLNYARWQIWTRFPMTEDYALSEPRQKQYEEAAAMLKDPYIATGKPDYSDDPSLSSLTAKTSDSAISMPWMKFPAMPFDNGFWQVYAYEWEKMGK